MSYEVQRAALEHDAKIWDATGTVLGTAKTTAAGLDAYTNATSVVGDLSGFNSAYAELQSFVETLLAGGDTATGRMATTLRDVKRQYEADDEAARAAIGALWAPVE